jgi:hypothetical protein
MISVLLVIVQAGCVEVGIWRTKQDESPPQGRACGAHHRGVGWSDRGGDFRRDHLDLAELTAA